VALKLSEIEQVCVKLTDLISTDDGLQNALDRIAALACELIDSCEMAGISWAGSDGIKTAAHTHDLVLEIDKIQHELREGPCVDSLGKIQSGAGSSCQLLGDVRSDRTWPRFSSRASDRGLGSLLAFSLGASESTLSALNLYSTKPDAFDEHDLEIGSLFAAQGAAVLSAIKSQRDGQDESRQLREALATRDTIATAKGILMEREKISDAEAFDLLRTASQHLNMKLREVARQVVGADGSPSGESPSRDKE
jgi:transcriptional regulator with GAF, ATPase, and Fis domain